MHWWGDQKSSTDSVTRPKGHPRLSDIEFRRGRGEWGHKAEFFLSCLGFSVGLGNVWRFPYLAYENGGAVFLMAYLVLQFLVGKPMYLMELSLGQFSGKSPSRIWDMNPAAKGVGFSISVIALITAVYYNIIMAYTLYYFFASMQSTLPWTVCQENWVKDYNCVAQRQPECTSDKSAMEERGACTCIGQAAIDNSFSFNCTKKVVNATTAAELYFYKSVIKRSAGIEPSNIGAPIPILAFLLFCSWTIVVICLIKGIKSSGKVVYFTATFPYFILIILLIRVSLLDGAVDGATFFLVPDWSKLSNLNVWLAAAGQMFFSLGVSFGPIITLGSYNKFNNQVYSDALIIASLDLVTSIIGGLVVFTTFGVMAKAIGSSVKNVAKSGYGLAFVVYPEALSYMPPTHLWSLLFFFMFFTLGLDSEFAFIETVLSSIQDQFVNLRAYKSTISISLGVFCYLVGLPCVCPGGDYVVTLLDQYGADFSVIIVACFETIAVMWVYGVMNFLKDLEYMLGKKPRAWQYWVFCWTVSCPLVTAVLFMYRMIRYKPPKYPTGEPFPLFAQVIGWMITAVALCPMPLWFGYMVFQSFSLPHITTWQQRKRFLFSPTRHWVPNDGRAAVVD